MGTLTTLARSRRPGPKDPHDLAPTQAERRTVWQDELLAATKAALYDHQMSGCQECEVCILLEAAVDEAERALDERKEAR